jgi:excisionase family DNA binding protein
MNTLRTIPDAAQSLGLAASTLRLQVKLGKLAAVKVGRDWLLAPAEIERYRRENKRP